MSGTNEDSLAKTAGTPITITLKGKELVLSPLSVNDLASLESKIRSDRVQEFLENAKMLEIPKIELLTALQELTKGGIDQDEISSYMSSLTGVRYLLWRAINKNQPDMSIEDVGNLLDLNNFDKIGAILQGLGMSDEGETTNPPAVKKEND